MLNLLPWHERRPGLFDEDIDTIVVMYERFPAIAPILIANEMSMRQAGQIVLMEFLTANMYFSDVLKLDPLFTITDRQTIRMTRFSHENEKPLIYFIKKECRDRLRNQEAKRLGCQKWQVNSVNFYQGLLFENDLYGKYCNYLPGSDTNSEDLYYLNACLIFNKPWMYDIPPSYFFCLGNHPLVNGYIQEMTEEQKENAMKVYRPDIKLVTNGEMEFLVNLNK